MENIELVVKAVQDYVRRCLAPFADRVGKVEKAIAEIPAGKDGAPGERGPQGEKGDPGEKGDAGPQGPAGEKGEKGDRGDDGKPGEKGDRGEKGESGPAGKDGAPGADGQKGDPGERGEKGLDGAKGDPGQDGRDGQEGPAGRDALQIEVLSGIDPERKYHRNTYAKHKGGLWRSFRQTDLLGEDESKSGWECIVNGIHTLDFSLGEDMRTVTMTVRSSDGQTVEKSAQVPTVIDRGVWKDGSFTAGDGTTWEGCFWIAQRKTEPGEKPGDSSGAWRMAVKKGRDGRDGLKGDKGERGAEGRAGKDLTQMGPNGSRW
jgi:hypothetical protein